MKKNNTTANKKEAILATGCLVGMMLSSVGVLMYLNSEEKTLYSGTVVKKIEIDGRVVFAIDTDGNKDSIESVIEVKRNDDDALYVGKIKEGSEVKFKHLKGSKEVANIYQIDDFIVRGR